MSIYVERLRSTNIKTYRIISSSVTIGSASLAKILTFKTGGVDGCDCAEILSLIEQQKINTLPLITHSFPLSRIEDAYRLFENKEDRVIKVAIDIDQTKGHLIDTMVTAGSPTL